MRRQNRGSAWLLALATACIIPDREISFEADEANPGAVRIVQPTLLAPDMIADCTAEDLALRDPDQCPQVPSVGARHSGLIRRLRDEPFCVCPGHDARTLDEFFIYAEDPDRAQDRPVDELIAVALLDFDPFGALPPSSALAYDGHIPEGELLLDRNRPSSPGAGIVASTGREDNLLWRFRFGKSGGRGTDLCNGAGTPVLPGLHTLSVMVTDRAFFQPRQLDANGEPKVAQDGTPLYEDVQDAMPDLAVGATYSIASWVFECHSPEVNNRCLCAEGPPP